jgi:putative sulfotransferase
MIRLHPRVLSISEWFTVLGAPACFDHKRLDAPAFLEMLTVPTRDVIELVARHPELPELKVPERLRVRAASEGIAPVLLIPLPHLDTHPEGVLGQLRWHLRHLTPRSLSEWHVTAFSFLARYYGKPLWLERSDGSLAYLYALCQLWSNARYIHIYRDGLACALSMYRHPYFRVRVARASARRPLPIGQCLESPPPIEQFGAYWSAVIAGGLRLLRRLPREDVLHVSYEQLLAEPRSVLRRVEQFLEGPTEADQWVERAKGCIRPCQSTSDGPNSNARLERACLMGMYELSRLQMEL